MEYKSIDFVALWSGIMGALSVAGAASAHSWSRRNPSAQTGPMTLTLSWFAFWMISAIARNVRTAPGGAGRRDCRVAATTAGISDRAA